MKVVLWMEVPGKIQTPGRRLPSVIVAGVCDPGPPLRGWRQSPLAAIRFAGLRSWLLQIVFQTGVGVLGFKAPAGITWTGSLAGLGLLDILDGKALEDELDIFFGDTCARCAFAAG